VRGIGCGGVLMVIVDRREGSGGMGCGGGVRIVIVERLVGSGDGVRATAPLA
jgi:hypothetical protein